MRYALSLPKEKIADATQMKTMSLKKVSEHEMHLVVTHELLKRSIEEQMRDILNFIGDDLRNDNIQITVSIDDSPVTHHAYVPKDVLKELSKHESVKMLVEKLKLEIS